MNEDNLFPVGNVLPKEWFSGNAYLTLLVTKDKNNAFSVGSITFEPGARTNWHTHPKGQILMITSGMGIYQVKGKTPILLKKGDVINIPENLEHWHGATSDCKMVHIAITNFIDDLQVTWLQAVTEEEYKKASSEI